MRKLLLHYFTPHELNNYRSKLLHHSSLFAFALLLFVGTFAINYTHKTHPEVLGISYTITEQDLLKYTNQARQENGLPALSLNQSLITAASAKADDMFAKNYWAHFAPDGTSPWYFIKNAGYNYLFAGENLAEGFTDSKSIVDAWMNSPSHRENLLSDKYKDIGFAIEEGNLQGHDVVLVVQMFGAQDVPLPIAQASPIPQPTRSVITLTPAPTYVAASSPAVVTQPTVVQQNLDANHLEKSMAKAEPKAAITPSFLNTSVINNPLFNLSSPTRAIPVIIIASLLLALIIDFVIIERKKIPRLVGHNLDHIMILAMFLLLLLLDQFSAIL